MPRKPLERSAFYPYHVCNRSIDKTYYPVELSEAWNVCCDLLRTLRWIFDARIHAFVLMSNHYHLLISTPSENLFDCIRYFQTEFSKWISNETGSGIYVFSGRYKYSIIKDPAYYSNVYRYVYQNPVRGGICSQVEEYPWSSLRGRLGIDKHMCPISDHEYTGCLPAIEDGELEWLNFVLEADELDRTRKGLKHAEFRYPQRNRKVAKREGVLVKR